MSLSLGLDTGGTYTDAVILDEETQQIVAKAKALTTHDDLAVGLGKAIDAVIATAGIAPETLSLVCISTTLATNALVEGRGGRAGLVMIGFEDRDLRRGGLAEAIGSDPVICVPGGHDVHGRAQAFDLSAAVKRAVSHMSDVSAFAIAGLFAVRNPEHELAMREALIEQTGKSVTCSHELSADLDGPKRALTTLLNARLISMIGNLLDAVGSRLATLGISVPVMVARGDGSLVSSKFAGKRPIETILSGPAASLVGARFLTGQQTALVCDIGGTTTDIAALNHGRPKLDLAGARVGGFQTMVKAIAMRTHGLGGDSAVRLDDNRLMPGLQLGPERWMPLSLLGHRYGDGVHEALRAALQTPFPDRMAGMFVWRTSRDRTPAGLSKSEAQLFSQLPDEPAPANEALAGQSVMATLQSLFSRGLVAISGVTPSDAQHVLGRFDHWDADAARLGLEVFARQKDGYGKPVAGNAEALAARIVDRLVHISAQKCLETALGEDGAQLAASEVAQMALRGTPSMARFAVSLDRPLIGLGAGAAAYYPSVGERLGATVHVPEHADVANAIGAVTGRVRIDVTLEVAPTPDGRFRILGGEMAVEARLHSSEADAISSARASARNAALAKIADAGGDAPEVQVAEDVTCVDVDGAQQFVSARITATGVARPALAG